MTIGEHLEELRWRLILGVAGVFLAFIACFVFSDKVIYVFCLPLIKVLQKYDINPQMVTDEVGEGFMVAIQISLIVAAAISGPWTLYQIWQFVAAGLYPHERKYVTKYLPLSMGLLISGMLFVYFLVLPWTLDFFIGWSTGIPLFKEDAAMVEKPATRPTTQPTPSQPGANGGLGEMIVPQLDGNPKPLREGMIWFDTKQQRLKFVYKGQVRVIPFNSNNLLAPEIKLETYINLVVSMLITFGVSFQLPLVVLTLERIGIVDMEFLRGARRYVYFAMAILAAMITPGDVITATIALVIPLILLYELGIWLARAGNTPATS